jgi:hypothetical protein
MKQQLAEYDRNRSNWLEFDVIPLKNYATEKMAW